MVSFAELSLENPDLEVILKELRSTLGKMELALGSIDEAIVWTGEDTGIQWCNATFDRFVGKLHITILGNSLLDLLPLKYEGKPVSEGEHPTLRVLRGEFETTEYEYQIPNTDRELILEISGSYLEIKTGEKAAVMTIRDITERKRMQRSLIEANQEIAALNEKLKEENLRLSAELDVACQLQQMVLPRPAELEGIEGLDIAGFMDPAEEVGGDYYDVLQTDGIVTIGIGDVTGHGLESGVLMLMAQTAVLTLQEMKERDPIKFLDTVNRSIYHNVKRMNSERNLTLAILNYSEGRLSISGQHEDPLVVRADGTIERIDTIDLGVPLGVDGDIANFIDRTFVELQPGDGVVLYTDGITEAYNADKEQYGTDRLAQAIAQNWQGSAEDTKQAIVNDLRNFIGEQKVFDDITLLVLKQRK